MILRDYQQACVDAVFAWLDANEGNPLLVMPTGSGKSIVIAEIVRTLALFKPRVLVITHVKELIAQNRSKLPKDIDAGIYSAGLGSRRFNNMVTFCGIQSVYKKASLFGSVDLVIIDEAHLLPPSGDAMYQKFLSDLLTVNPKMRIIGLTATPFRTSGVLVGDGNLFDDIAYDVPMGKLIKDGYLAPLKSRSSETQADMTGVWTTAGEFNIIQMAERHEAVTEAAVAEICKLGADRKGWLIFACNVDHCFHVRAELEKHGVSCGVVTGESEDRDDVLNDYKSGRIRAVVNYGVLTTGFDAPHTDLIGLLRSTQSPGLYVQILGRGMRTAPGKTDCLVLDYGGNIERHGPVDCIRVKEKRQSDGKKEREVEKQPVIICPACRSPCHPRCPRCPECGYEFPIEVKIEEKASTAAVMSEDEPVTEMRVVETVYVKNYGKNGKPDTLRVSYYSPMGKKVTEWVCLNHTEGMAARKARAWWAAHCILPGHYPENVDNALQNLHLLKTVKKIEHRKENGFDRIYRYELEDPFDSEPSGNKSGYSEFPSEEDVF